MGDRIYPLETASTTPIPRADRGPVLGRAEALDRWPSLDAEVWARADERFPVRITRSWASRLESPDDPLGLQALPRPLELEVDPGDVADPVGEGRRSPVPWIVQKHPDRVLLLTTRRCHLYCRYCFRRGDHGGAEDPTPAELETALDYIRGSGARELILSGGDPLALSDRKLFYILDAVRGAVPIVRVHTRAPITAPERVTPELVNGLRARAPVWVLVHANHPAELSVEVRGALARLVDSGLPVLNQAVLLAGVNDDVDTLVALCEHLLVCRVFPYYLHHTDAAPGNAELRVSLSRGLELYASMRQRLSGIALPQYVIDPPDGTGKVPVETWVREQESARRSP